MDDTFKSDFPTIVFLIAGITILLLGIILGVFVIYPNSGISVTIVTIVVLAVIGCAFFHMFYLTAGKRSKYVIKRYGRTNKMILRKDLEEQAKIASEFSRAAAKKKTVQELSGDDDRE